MTLKRIDARMAEAHGCSARQRPDGMVLVEDVALQAEAPRGALAPMLAVLRMPRQANPRITANPPSKLGARSPHMLWPGLMLRVHAGARNGKSRAQR